MDVVRPPEPDAERLTAQHDARALFLSLLSSGVTRPFSSSSCYVDVAVHPLTKRNAHSSSSNWVHPLRQQTECEQLRPPPVDLFLFLIISIRFNYNTTTTTTTTTTMTHSL